MRRKDWIFPLIVGALIYLSMRFVVPHSLNENTRSVIGGVIGFIVAIAVLTIANRTSRTRT